LVTGGKSAREYAESLSLQRNWGTCFILRQRMKTRDDLEAVIHHPQGQKSPSGLLNGLSHLHEETYVFDLRRDWN